LTRETDEPKGSNEINGLAIRAWRRLPVGSAAASIGRFPDLVPSSALPAPQPYPG
jgi:hypothetical protein